MNRAASEIRAYLEGWRGAWTRFWFTPSDPATLGLIRILAGATLFYTHLVWSKDLLGFFGPSGRLPEDFVRTFQNGSPFAWSPLFALTDQPVMLWTFHIVALVILFAFMLGLGTRVTGVLAFLITVAYANRATGALFGLDQINGLLALYLAIGPSGAAYSLDRWIQNRRGRTGPSPRTSGATLSIRLMQVHMCVVYLFAGLGKLQGETWWNGEAFWGALANYEYQSLDLTWMAAFPWIINIATHVTIAWEISYSALIWPMRTRPLMLLMAIPLHLGIGLAMGMMTFGTIMLIANMAFIPPSWIRGGERAITPTSGGTGSLSVSGSR